jgi:hypothetical protein
VFVDEGKRTLLAAICGSASEVARGGYLRMSFAVPARGKSGSQLAIAVLKGGTVFRLTRFAVPRLRDGQLPRV